jgi:hypothetical protein
MSQGNGSLIAAPDDAVVPKTEYLTPDDAKIIRAYERWLKVHRLQRPDGVGVYCAACFESDRQDGTRYFVEPHRIYIECRCTVRVFTGPTT